MAIHVSRPSIGEEEINAAIVSLKEDRLVLGKNVDVFEREFAAYVGVEHAVSVSSGTDALILTLSALRDNRQYVITTPHTFISTANSILYANKTPIFVDIDEGTYNMSVTALESALKQYSGQVAAILVVHLYGYPADMYEIIRLGKEFGVFVIEDACQAHGAERGHRKVGGIGIAGCFSFYSTKNMTVGGDGGMITTNDKQLADTLIRIRNNGRLARYEHDILGRTSRLDSLKASIGSVQLKRLDAMNARRREIADLYTTGLAHLAKRGALRLPPSPHGEVLPAYHLYVIRTESRDSLMKFLEERGIETNIQYPIPVHLQPIYRDLMGFQEGAYPITEKICKEILSIPMHPNLTNEQVLEVISSINAFFQ